MLELVGLVGVRGSNIVALAVVEALVHVTCILVVTTAVLIHVCVKISADTQPKRRECEANKTRHVRRRNSVSTTSELQGLGQL